MESTIQILIYINAFLGGVGLISVFVTKGDSVHRKAGNVFSYSMVISALISLFVSRMPGHENLFLFLIGIFTLYMVLAGNRALTFRSPVKSKANLIDYLISGSMLVVSVVMVCIGVYGVIQSAGNSILFIFFGVFGILLTIKDFNLFRNFVEKKDTRLKNHIGRMVGALIASVTAFLVAGLNVGTVIVWILPSLVGTAYVVYWSRRISMK